MKLFLIQLLLTMFALHSWSQTLSVSSSNIQAQALPNTVSLNISSNTYWGIYGYASWIKPRTVWASQNQTVYFDIDENAYMLNRSNSFTIYWTDANGVYFSDLQVTINQSANTHGLADSVIYIDASAGSTAQLGLISNTYWEISNLPQWLQVDNNYTHGNADINFTANENPLFSTRTANITLHRLAADSSFVSGQVSVYQSGSNVGISTNRLRLASANGSSDNIMILTDSQWTISNLSYWLTVSSMSGSGSDMLSITAQANTTIYERSNTFKISLSNGVEYLVTVIQNPAPYTFQLNQSSTNFGANTNASIEITVQSNTYWGLGQVPNWILQQNIFSFGDSSFSITALPNPYMITRSATILPYWLDNETEYLGHEELILTQSANTSGLSDSILQIGSTLGSTASFSIQTNGMWQIVNLPQWLSANTTQGSGNATITLTASANPLSGTRSRIITVRRQLGQGVTLEGTITVYQSAGEQGVSTNLIYIDAHEGSTVDFSVINQGAYSLSVNDAWLNLSTTQTSGNQTITITANENPNIYTRNSWLYVSYADGSEQQIYITQKASEPKFNINPEIVIFGNNGGARALQIESNTFWGLAQLPSWIVEQDIFEEGNQSISLTALPNPNTESRIDSVLCYWVKQDASTDYKWIVFWQIGNEGTTQNTASHTYNLTEGWNLISFNLLLDNNNVENVLAPIIQNVMVIKNSESYFIPGNSQHLNRLIEINIEDAYLIKMSANATLTLSGTIPNYSYLQLNNSLSLGWNMVGFPFETADDIINVFNQNIIIIKNFDGFYEPNGNQNSLRQLEPGKGYFINAN